MLHNASGNSALLPDTVNNNASRYFAADCKDPRFFISAAIDIFTNALRFTIVTKIRSSGDTSAVPPEIFFDEMMYYFNSNGGCPDAIRGIWNDSDPEKTTNLNVFNTLIAGGASAEEAAKETFTGRMAVKYNFTKVSFGSFDPPNGTAPFKSVNVYFKR